LTLYLDLILNVNRVRNCIWMRILDDDPQKNLHVKVKDERIYRFYMKYFGKLVRK